MKSVLAGLLALGAAGGGLAAARLELETPLSGQPGRAGPDSAQVAAFLGSLDAADPVICQDIADSYGNFWWGDRRGIGQLNDWSPAVRARRDSLRHQVTDRPALDLLRARLDAPNSCVRRVAAKMLGMSWPASRPAVLAGLDGSSARAREAALLALGTVEDPATLDRIDRAVGDPDVGVAAMAVWALGEIENIRSLPVLKRALDHKATKVRQTAIWALGKLEDARAVPWLLPALRDADAGTRTLAARALGDIESPLAVDGLIPLVDDRDDDVREAAVHALGEIEDKRALAALSRAAADRSNQVRTAAVRAIGSLDGVEQAPSEVILALRSDDLELRRAAAETLGDIEDPKALPALAARLDDPDLETRRAIVKAIAGIDHPDAAKHLMKALKDEDPEIRQAAAEALGERGKSH